MKQKTAVLLVEQDGYWSARSADVLDVYAFGSSREEACLHLGRGIAAHIHALQERGLTVPAFTAQVGVTTTDVLG